MYLLIINPRSGGGAGQRTWQSVEGMLKARGIAYEPLFTQSAAEAEEQVLHALARREDWRAAILIGGDGTIHSVLGALRRRGVPLAVIPAGSGNDTARGFGIPLATEAALDAALQDRCLEADLLAGTGGLTLTAVASGFDAQVAVNVNNSRYKRLCNAVGAGQLAYIIGILHTLITFKPCRVSVTLDGKEQAFDQAWLVSVCNLPSYGGGLLICPQAETGDGRLDVCVVHGCSRAQVLRLFPTLLKGTHVALPFVTMLRGRSVAVRFAQPRHAIGDGEPLGTAPLAVRCEPGALRVLTPLAAAAHGGSGAAGSCQASG
ncbi:lipid kinase [Paenibacillus sp. FSL R7-0273]|uniref:diacylglycerol/lipid kinase family protein n=1 Tax=Paenibacillus sp. FSL R7-0273 TaxID=1536772 RepID=UPI0004F70533|nr:diacylglycerol kinase family protein [Paenibacillus sp. FSL R7-0273]AIQ44869.1 lipid kinase [Paenibacillus sp. FSL R7-0273]OMF93276.1 lipid kinase [Paenibacillus sp. FSL R7-0273]